MSRFAPGTDLSKYEPDSLKGGRPRLKEEFKDKEPERDKPRVPNRGEGPNDRPRNSASARLERFQELLNRTKKLDSRLEKMKSREKKMRRAGKSGIVSRIRERMAKVQERRDRIRKRADRIRPKK